MACIPPNRGGVPCSPHPYPLHFPPPPNPQIFAEAPTGEGEAAGLLGLALWLRTNVHWVVVCLVLYAVVAHVRMASVALEAHDARIGALLELAKGRKGKPEDGSARPTAGQAQAGSLSGGALAGGQAAEDASTPSTVVADRQEGGSEGLGNKPPAAKKDD